MERYDGFVGFFGQIEQGAKVTNREELIAAFLQDAGWDTASRSNLAGDASARSYDRLTRGDERAVLMNAPPDQGVSIQPFLQVGNMLSDAGFSAPTVIASDVDAGLILLEDLGDDLFARLCKNDPAIEAELYEIAIDVLVAIQQKCSPVGLPPYDMATYLREARLLVEWYMPAATGRPVDAALSDEFDALVTAVCQYVVPSSPVVIMRDYHSENLLWLPDRQGAKRVGLLDYQDALAGHPAYDLVSLLEDARRDTSENLRAAMMARYAMLTGADLATLQRNYNILGMQRNGKILGIFVRLWMRDKKPTYIDLLPRVWAHFQRDLRDPVLAEMRDWVAQHVPAPEPDILETIRRAGDAS